MAEEAAQEAAAELHSAATVAAEAEAKKKADERGVSRPQEGGPRVTRKEKRVAGEFLTHFFVVCAHRGCPPSTLARAQHCNLVWWFTHVTPVGAGGDGQPGAGGGTARVRGDGDAARLELATRGGDSGAGIPLTRAEVRVHAAPVSPLLFVPVESVHRNPNLPLSLPHHDPTSPSPSCMGTKNFIERDRCPLLLKVYDLVFGLTPVLLAGRVLHDQLAVTTV